MARIHVEVKGLTPYFFNKQVEGGVPKTLEQDVQRAIDLVYCSGKQVNSFKPKDYDKFDPIKIQGEFLGKLKNIITPMGIKRVVIDSISPLSETLARPADRRRSLYETIEFLKEKKITALVISEDSETEEHLFDGVIKLRQQRRQCAPRSGPGRHRRARQRAPPRY